MDYTPHTVTMQLDRELDHKDDERNSLMKKVNGSWSGKTKEKERDQIPETREDTWKQVLGNKEERGFNLDLSERMERGRDGWYTWLTRYSHAVSRQEDDDDKDSIHDSTQFLCLMMKEKIRESMTSANQRHRTRMKEKQLQEKKRWSKETGNAILVKRLPGKQPFTFTVHHERIGRSREMDTWHDEEEGHKDKDSRRWKRLGWKRWWKSYPRVVMVTIVYQKAAGIEVNVVPGTFFSA